MPHFSSGRLILSIPLRRLAVVQTADLRSEYSKIDLRNEMIVIRQDHPAPQVTAGVGDTGSKGREPFIAASVRNKKGLMLEAGGRQQIDVLAIREVRGRVPRPRLELTFFEQFLADFRSRMTILVQGITSLCCEGPYGPTYAKRPLPGRS